MDLVRRGQILDILAGGADMSGFRLVKGLRKRGVEIDAKVLGLRTWEACMALPCLVILIMRSLFDLQVKVGTELELRGEVQSTDRISRSSAYKMGEELRA